MILVNSTSGNVMNQLMQYFNIYMIPPLFTLVMGVTIAVISIVKGTLKAENILFSLLCLWWVMLTPVFLCHHIFYGNDELLLTIERRVHFFYVYLLPLNLIFFYWMTNTRIRFIIPVSIIFSFIFSLLTFTDYYFFGFYKYKWGYIAKGGWAFQGIELMGSALVLYLVYFFIKKIRTEKNSIMRLKLKYILFSFILSGLLTMTNIPALNGVDFYPLSNFIFIPLAFMAYGVLSYRLLDIRSVLHKTFMWAVLSSLIIIPNGILFFSLYSYMTFFGSTGHFIMALIWFSVNFIYFLKIQPFIDQLFNKRKYDLHNAEAIFIEEISRLTGVDALLSQFTAVIQRSLSFRYAWIIIVNPALRTIVGTGYINCSVSPVLEEWFTRTNHLVDRDMVESNSVYEDIRTEMLQLFAETGAQFMVPVMHAGRVSVLLSLPEKSDLHQLKRYEVVFVNNIRAAFSISLDNAIIYSDINKLNDNLEKIVVERTQQLTDARDILLSDIELARKTQIALLPRELPFLEGAEIFYKYEPMMGVSGDFIDLYIPDNENTICLFICDVSGHGVSAALIAAMVKMSLLSWDTNAGNPAQLMSDIHDALEGKMGGNFMTAISCHVNLETGKMIYANAGHPPMIIMRADGSAEFINAKGRLISEMVPANCENAELSLNDNDMLILYTDGILEECNSSGFFGEERFIEVLKKYSQKPVKELCSAVYDELIAFKGNDQLNDDFTFFAMRYNAKNTDEISHIGSAASFIKKP